MLGRHVLDQPRDITSHFRLADDVHGVTHVSLKIVLPGASRVDSLLTPDVLCYPPKAAQLA